MTAYLVSNIRNIWYELKEHGDTVASHYTGGMLVHIANGIQLEDML